MDWDATYCHNVAAGVNIMNPFSSSLNWSSSSYGSIASWCLAASCFGMVGVYTESSCCGLWLDLRVGVLTDVENNGIQRTRGFIQVRASMRIKTLHVVCVGCIMIHWIETPSTPPFIGKGGVGFTCKTPSVIIVLDPDSLYLPCLQDSIYNYLLNHLDYGPPGLCP
jgi:hypothetical protein